MTAGRALWLGTLCSDELTTAQLALSINPAFLVQVEHQIQVQAMSCKYVALKGWCYLFMYYVCILFLSKSP